MRLDRYTRVADFLAAAGDFLAAREAEHNLILGVSSSLAVDPDEEEPAPYLASISDGDEVLGAAMRTPPHNLILSEIDHPEVPRLVADDVAHEEIPGLVGPPQAVRAFADAWIARRGGSWRELRAERIYRLSQLMPPRTAAGGARLAASVDEPLLVDWLVAFHSEVLDAAESGFIRRGLEAWRRGRRRYWLWELDGRPVSLVGAAGETPNGIRIGPVYTPPDERGHGFASNLTATVTRIVLDEGRRFCFLYTDLANPTSNRIYQAIGYEPVTDALMVAFEGSGGPG
jgi:uncharacterized protein